MPFIDLRVAAVLQKPFHRNKDFAAFVSQYHDESILWEWVSQQAINGTHLLLGFADNFDEPDTVGKLESSLVEVLTAMEVTGVHIDTKKLAILEKKLEKEAEELKNSIFEWQQPFNLNSPAQLQVFLFEQKGIKPIKKTKTGWSTDEETLSLLAGDHPVCAQILEYRHITKLLNTYVQKLPTHIDKHTKRLHTTYDQVGAATGRMSSDSPNLQNIPAWDPHSDEVKACFCPATSDFKYLVADYSQVELRILACLTKDEALLEVFRSGMDVHERTARAIFPDEEVISPRHRTQAKSVNFGVIYGITGFGLSKMMPISPTEWKEYIDRFYTTYPKVGEYYSALLEQARKDGYVQTYFGRKRWLPGLGDANAMMRQAAEREAINMPIQGTSADIIKLAMVDIDHKLRHGWYKSRMIMQVHDELVFEVHSDEQDTVSTLIREAMEWVVDWEIPLSVNIGIGENWSQAK